MRIITVEPDISWSDIELWLQRLKAQWKRASQAGVVEVEMRHCLGQISTLVCFDCNKDKMALR